MKVIGATAPRSLQWWKDVGAADRRVRKLEPGRLILGDDRYVRKEDNLDCDGIRNWIRLGTTAQIQQWIRETEDAILAEEQCLAMGGGTRDTLRAREEKIEAWRQRKLWLESKLEEAIAKL